MTSHLVQFSGGVGSWAAAKRVVERYGTDDVVLLCADTMSEGDDWYEFVEKAAADVGVPLTMLRHGKDVWQLANEQHMIPNTRADFCSRILKRELLWPAIESHPDPVVYLGIDITEVHRLDPIRAAHPDIEIVAPLAEWDPVVLSKRHLIDDLRDSGLPFPAAYKSALPHNNCMKHGCVKGGHAYWRTLYRDFPETFARAEAEETAFREKFGNYSILRDRKGGETDPFSLAELRAEIEEELWWKPSLFVGSDWGASCACF